MGRFGGDEFVVLMRSLPGEEIVEQKCKILFGNFQKLSERLRIELTCSVGGIFVTNLWNMSRCSRWQIKYYMK